MTWIRATPVPLMIACALACAFGLALLAWWPWPQTPPSGSVALAPSKEVRNEVKVALTTAMPARVYSAKVKAKLSLPDAIQSDPAQHVTAAGKLDAQERPYTLTAVLNADTGESAVYARADPLPWVSSTQRGEAGMHYGFKNGATITRLSISQSFLNIKAVRLGASGTLDSDGQWFAGAGLSYRW